MLSIFATLRIVTTPLLIFIYFYSRGLMARNILIHQDGTAKVGLLTSNKISTCKNMSISGEFVSTPLFCRIVNCQPYCYIR